MPVDLRQYMPQPAPVQGADALAALLLKYKGSTALVVIDVQGKVCAPKAGFGNEETAAVSKRIGALAPAFRQAGIPVYAVYSAMPGDRQTGFYEFKPCLGDVLVEKDQSSAFAGGDIRGIIDKDRMKLLLVCGFNLNACVKETVMDALSAGFNVCVLRDLTGNNLLAAGTDDDERQALAEMRQAGALLVQSGQVLNGLQARAENGARLVAACA